MTEQEHDAYIAEWRKSPPPDTWASRAAQIVVFSLMAFLAVAFLLGCLAAGGN